MTLMTIEKTGSKWLYDHSREVMHYEHGLVLKFDRCAPGCQPLIGRAFMIGGEAWKVRPHSLRDFQTWSTWYFIGTPEDDLNELDRLVDEAIMLFKLWQ